MPSFESEVSTPAPGWTAISLDELKKNYAPPDIVAHLQRQGDEVSLYLSYGPFRAEGKLMNVLRLQGRTGPDYFIVLPAARDHLVPCPGGIALGIRNPIESEDDAIAIMLSTKAHEWKTSQIKGLGQWIDLSNPVQTAADFVRPLLVRELDIIDRCTDDLGSITKEQ